MRCGMLLQDTQRLLQPHSAVRKKKEGQKIKRNKRGEIKPWITASIIDAICCCSTLHIDNSNSPCASQCFQSYRFHQVAVPVTLSGEETPQWAAPILEHQSYFTENLFPGNWLKHKLAAPFIHRLCQLWWNANCKNPFSCPWCVMATSPAQITRSRIFMLFFHRCDFQQRTILPTGAFDTWLITHHTQ